MIMFPLSQIVSIVFGCISLVVVVVVVLTAALDIEEAVYKALHVFTNESMI